MSHVPLAERAGVTRMTTHVFRHARLGELASASPDTAAIQFAASHESLATTDRYVRSRSERTGLVFGAADSGTSQGRATNKRPSSRRRFRSWFSSVPDAGVEPACDCSRGILSPLRLPFRQSGAPRTATKEPTSSERRTPDARRDTLECARWEEAHPAQPSEKDGHLPDSRRNFESPATHACGALASLHTTGFAPRVVCRFDQRWYAPRLFRSLNRQDAGRQADRDRTHVARPIAEIRSSASSRRGGSSSDFFRSATKRAD